jgi:hypothetical protein
VLILKVELYQYIVNLSIEMLLKVKEHLYELL